jgi:hypothetical protein
VSDDPFAERALEFAQHVDALRRRLNVIEQQWLTGLWDLSKRIHDLEAALITVKTCMETMLDLLQREYGDDDDA